MNRAIPSLLLGVALLAPISLALADGVLALPGDRGRPMNGIMPAPGAPRPAMPPQEPKAAVSAPSLELALKAAEAIAEGCKQYPLGVAVTDSQGVAKLIYVPDRSEAWHGYSAVRKAYTALSFGMDSSQVMKMAQEDPNVAARVKADPNLQAFSGGLLLKVGDKIIGALAVSGAEPGGHDEECGLIGLNKIRGELK